MFSAMGSSGSNFTSSSPFSDSIGGESSSTKSELSF